MTHKYFHTTVPHSGTRYVLETLAHQGVSYAQVHNQSMIENFGAPVMFCHVGRRWIDFIVDQCENTEYAWMTVRSPIHTWGTQWRNVSPRIHEHFWTAEKLGQMREQYETQMEIVDRVPDLHIHRVEDPIQSLGDWLGMTLPDNGNRFSQDTPMKKALRERDITKIKELCEGSDFFDVFQESITPDIRGFYENLGYEIWWIDG